MKATFYKYLLISLLLILDGNLSAQIVWGPKQTDYRRDLRKLYDNPVESYGLGDINSQYVLGVDYGWVKRAVYQWDIPDFEIPDNSQIDYVKLTFTYSKMGHSIELTANFFKIGFDMIGENYLNEIFAVMNGGAGYIGGQGGSNNQIIFESNNPSNQFNQAIRTMLEQDKFVLGIKWQADNNPYIYRWLVDNWTINLYLEFTPPNQLVTVDQRNSNNQQVGILRKWEGSNWGNNLNPGAQFNFPVNSEQTILGDHTIISNQKYNNWNEDLSDVKNHHTFAITSETNELTSRFEPTYSTITIKNSLEGTTTNGGNLEFGDPWFIDYQDPNFAYQWRNRGMNDALFYSRTSPFYPNYSTSYNGLTYKGVFLNQLVSTGTYYKVRALQYQDIDLGGQIGTRRFYFQNWSGTDVEFQDASSFETGVVFTSSNATASAVLKGVGLSNNQNGYGTGSQQKFVRLYYGTLFSIYTSLNKVWLEISENNGQSWDLWRNHIPYESNNEYSTPSIDWIPWTIAHSFAAIVCGINAGPISAELKVDVIRETNVTPKYSENIGIVGSDHPRPPFTPVIAVTENEIMVVCNSGTEIVGSGEEGLVYFYGSISNPGGSTVNVSWVNKDNPLKIPGSTYNSKSPTIMAVKMETHFILPGRKVMP